MIFHGYGKFNALNHFAMFTSKQGIMRLAEYDSSLRAAWQNFEATESAEQKI